jgi:hypothetical protein
MLILELVSVLPNIFGEFDIVTWSLMENNTWECNIFMFVIIYSEPWSFLTLWQSFCVFLSFYLSNGMYKK